jgi:hypothetical protein
MIDNGIIAITVYSDSFLSACHADCFVLSSVQSKHAGYRVTSSGGRASVSFGPRLVRERL